MSNRELPEIGSLIDDSWSLFKKSLFGLFLIDVVTLAAYVLLGLITFLFFISLYAFSGVNIFLTTFAIVIATILLLGGLFFIVLTSQNAMILTVDSSGKLPLEKALKKGLFFVVPLFLAHILSSFLELGGFMLLFIPGIVFSFFFVFVSYEVVLENRHWIHALRRSFAIVQTHFGDILIRLLVIMGIYFGIGIVIPRLLLKIDSYTSVMVLFISFFITILLKWYILCYNITLYKQAKAATDERHEKGIFWIVLVSLLGWVIGFIVISALITALNGLIQNRQMKKYMLIATPTPVIQF